MQTKYNYSTKNDTKIVIVSTKRNESHGIYSGQTNKVPLSYLLLSHVDLKVILAHTVPQLWPVH